MQINSFYLKGQGITVEQQLTHIFSIYRQTGVTVRLVFFGNPSDCEEYLAHLRIIAKLVNHNFGNRPPVFSYVAQPPLEGCRIVMEAFEIKPGSDTQLIYKRRENLSYITVESAKMKMLFLGGVRADSMGLNIKKQSDQVFSKLEDIFHVEELPVSSIIRQWNYIEQIIKTNDGHQNYQDFNDSRSLFYNKTTWDNGYPAATGVGTYCAGILIDLEALHPANSDGEIIPLNNSLQVPAHAYSPCVLVGDENTGRKTTPKFERAKLILSGQRGLIYISGTAAIRGEMSLKDVGVEEQTRITLENVEHLISKNTLTDAGIEGVADVELCSLRIYLKEEHFYEKSKKIIDKEYARVPSVYLKSDLCRDELLVEIEGLASVDFNAKHFRK